MDKVGYKDMRKKCRLEVGRHCLRRFKMMRTCGKYGC